MASSGPPGMRTVEWKGMAEYMAKLEKMEDAMVGRVMDEAALDALKPMESAAKAKAPRSGDVWGRSLGRSGARSAHRRGGQMADSITRSVESPVGMKSRLMKGSRRSMFTQRRAEVGPGKEGFWGHIVEFGYGRQDAQPFMRPAFDETQASVIGRFAANIGRILARMGR